MLPTSIATLATVATLVWASTFPMACLSPRAGADSPSTNQQGEPSPTTSSGPQNEPADPIGAPRLEGRSGEDGSGAAPKSDEPGAAVVASSGSAEPELSPTQAAAALEALSRESPTPERLSEFVRAHPQVLTAARPPYGSPLAWALEFEHEDVALALLEAGADPCAPFLGDTGALSLAARGGLLRFARAFLKGGHSCSQTGYWGAPLHFAAQYGHVEMAKLLLAHGADIEARAVDFSTTPLIRAATEGRVEMIDALLDAGAVVDARDAEGRTALHWAVFASRPREIHEWSEDGGPHSTYYEDPGPPRAVEALLRAGADVRAKDSAGRTPLHHAAALNATRAIAPLLRHGASKSAKDNAGHTPKELAQRAEHVEAAKML